MVHRMLDEKAPAKRRYHAPSVDAGGFKFVHVLGHALKGAVDNLEIVGR
jgi:hypothetical protein